MKKRALAILVGMFLVVGCLVVPGRRGPEVVVVPPLPAIVVLEEQLYYNSGFYYFFQNNRWSYSNSRSGPWTELPKDRYPREVRFKNRGADGVTDDRGGRR